MSILESDDAGASGRLAGLAELVPPGSRVADVGSDHGRLPRLLVATRRARSCVATERNAARLARLAAALGGLEVELRSGDGLGPLRADDRLDVVVIAGLGARSIRRILERGAPEELGSPRLVLAAQSPPGGLRAWLVSRGFSLTDGRLVRERGRFYELIAAEHRPHAARPVHDRLDDEALMAVGPELLARREPLLLALWRERLSLALALERSAAGPGLLRAAHQRRLARAVLDALGDDRTDPGILVDR